MAGAISGVMPAHGASSSHDSRSPTIAVGATTGADRRDHPSRAKQRGRHPTRRRAGWSARDRNWRTRLCWPALISTPSHPASAASLAASAKPSTTASMSSVSIHFGTSRVSTSGTRDGAHSGALAVRRRSLSAGVVERGDDERAVRLAGGDDRRPAVAGTGGQRRPLVRPVRRRGRSRPRSTIVPHPPRARRS